MVKLVLARGLCQIRQATGFPAHVGQGENLPKDAHCETEK